MQITAVHETFDDVAPGVGAVGTTGCTVHDVETFTDEELAELAMAADPDAPIDDDAVPFGRASVEGTALPEWYMPAPGSIRRTRPRMLAVVAIIVSFLIVDGAGFCVTNGWPEIAW